MSEIIKEYSENETIQNKATFFESLFIIIHKENGVLKEENTLIIEENITLTKNNSSLTEEVEYLKQIIANKDREIKFNENKSWDANKSDKKIGAITVDGRGIKKTSLVSILKRSATI